MKLGFAVIGCGRMGLRRIDLITGHNTVVGKKYFSYDVLRAHLNDAIEWAGSIGF